MDAPRLTVALLALAVLLALALLTWIAVRLEGLRRAHRPPPCPRLHVEELHARLMDAPIREDHLMPAEELPAFRGPARTVVDEDEVNPIFPR